MNRLLVVVKRTHIHNIESIAQSLRDEGLTVDKVLKITGVILASTEVEYFSGKSRLEAIEGVDAVEWDQEIFAI